MNNPGTRFTFSLKFVLVVAMIAPLTACATGKSNAERFDWGYEHRLELEMWVAHEADIAIEGTGIGAEGWAHWRSDPPLLWTEDREAVLLETRRGPCPVDSDEWARPWRLEMTIEHEGTEDAFAVAERMRAHWTLQGWVVSNVITPADMPGVRDPFISIRADREGEREMLAFMANPNIFVIDIYSDCSEDSSMTH